MTNRQWLETLTDKELAKWNFERECGMCAYNPERGICKNLSDRSNFDRNSCIDGIAKWLQAEHKEGEL